MRAGPPAQLAQPLGEDLESVLRTVPGTRNVLAERTAGGYYVDFVLDRDALARYGLSLEDGQMIITSAIGGEALHGTSNPPFEIELS